MAGYLSAKLSAHERFIGRYAGAPYVKPISIPACSNGGIVMAMPFGVPSAGVVEKFELLI